MAQLASLTGSSPEMTIHFVSGHTFHLVLYQITLSYAVYKFSAYAVKGSWRKRQKDLPLFYKRKYNNKDEEPRKVEEAKKRDITLWQQSEQHINN